MDFQNLLLRKYMNEFNKYTGENHIDNLITDYNNTTNKSIIIVPQGKKKAKVTDKKNFGK